MRRSRSRSDRRKLAPWMFLFMALGYTGGVLSLVMQHQPILESPHFYSKWLKAIFFEAILLKSHFVNASNVESTVILVRGGIKS